MHVMNWHKFNTAELTIDTTDKFIDCCAKILIFFDIASGGNCYLNQDDLS